MIGKQCSKCIYQDGVRADKTYKCSTPERQRDTTVVDCCVPVEPLRRLQRNAPTAEAFVFSTHQYVADIKKRSSYWRKYNKLNEQ
jgi:hypothetical protein